MKFGDYPKVGSFDGVASFKRYLADNAIDIPCDDIVASGPAAPLARSIEVLGRTIPNRFCVQPMEGWDGLADGNPSDNTIRRWRRFGESGAKFFWGGEAVAVRPDGKANPNQLTFTPDTVRGIARLRDEAIAVHRATFGSADDLVIGLQLTHSGRFCRPTDKKRLDPVILYRHPLLDKKFGVPASHKVMTDAEIARLIEDYVTSAKWAKQCGYDFVDIKHCHGYLGHEFLSARTRDGRYGGSFENRTRFLTETVAAIRAAVPGLPIAVRVSAFDLVPFKPDPARSVPGKLGPGIPEAVELPYRYAFGIDENQPTEIDLTEPKQFLGLLRDLGITLVNITSSSPYYNPHTMRPALYPPSDGYHPPEEPLVGVARHLQAVRDLKAAHPDLTIVGSAYTYLQEFLPNVAQAVVRQGWADFIGLGRMMLAYPELPRDVLSGTGVQTKRLCRTFSDCTTAPRNGLVSGCYPLDAFYKKSPESKTLAAAKKAQVA
ncbi:MAG: NADH:flavin oxidoreductase [Proteobacteria bacterium]|nr:NADH:flavin oxidoreductase [Pseudomonadota bacterium]